MIEQKQKDVLESIYTLFKVRNCFTCSYYDEFSNKCYYKHLHLPKTSCNEHKFKQ